MFSPFFLFLTDFLFPWLHDKLKAQAQQNVQAQEQKAEEKMLKYLLIKF